MSSFERAFDIFMLPLEQLVLSEYRKELIAHAGGDILELGAGTGANLSFYNYDNIGSIKVTDLEPGKLLQKRAAKFHGVSPERADVQNLSFDDNSFDTVVFTLVFCSVPDPQKGITEIKRVLKPDGKLIFIEHVVSCNYGLKAVQKAVTPFWRRIGSNCHLDRPTVQLFEDSGMQTSIFLESAFCLLAGGVGTFGSE